MFWRAANPQYEPSSERNPDLEVPTRVSECFRCVHVLNHLREAESERGRREVPDAKPSPNWKVHFTLPGNSSLCTHKEGGDGWEGRQLLFRNGGLLW